MLYLGLSDRGKNEKWRYLVGIFVILFMWMGVGSIPMALLVRWVGGDLDKNTYFDSEHFLFHGVDPALGFLVIMLASIPLLLGIYLVVRFIHKRTLRTLITPESKINWKAYLWGGSVMFAIITFFSVIGSLFFSESYQFVFEWKAFLPFLLLALVLIPIQASTEELLFRGYLMQSIGRFVKTRWIVVGLSSILFMLPHLFNPEAGPSPIIAIAAYSLIGVFLAVITLKSNSLELAMGAHTGINLFNCFVGSSADQVFGNIPTVFIRQEESVINIESLLALMVVFLLFYWVVFKGAKIRNLTLSVE